MQILWNRTASGGSTNTGAILMFNPDEWFVSDNATGQSATLHIFGLPGANIDDIEFRLNGGAWTSVGAASVGTHQIATPADMIDYTIEIRGVNTDSQSWPSIPRRIRTTPPGTIVASNAALVAALSAAANGDVITLSSSWTSAAINISNHAFSPANPVTINQQNGGSVRTSDASNCPGIEWVGVVFEHDNAGNGAISNPSAATTANNWVAGSDMKARNCWFDCGPSEDGSRRTTAQLGERFEALRTNASPVELDSCWFIRARDGFVPTSNGHLQYVHHCHFEQMYEDAVTGRAHWQFEYNTATLFEGRYERFWNSITVNSGSVQVGDILERDMGSGVKQIIQVTATDGSSVLTGEYNNYTPVPTTGNTFTNLSRAGSVTLNVGGTGTTASKHGDFFQPLLDFGANNVQLIATHNFVYRKTNFDFTQIGQETNVQVILAQNDLAGTGFWYPLDIRYNVASGGQPWAIKLERAGTATAVGYLSYNTAPWTEHLAVRTDIEFSSLNNVEVQFNVGDDNNGDAVDNISPASNTNITEANNVYVRRALGHVAANYPDAYTYPQRLQYFAPAVGQSVDLGNAGALDTAGAWRG